MCIRACVLAGSLAVGAPSIGFADFEEGQLFLGSFGWPTGPSIVEIDPATGNHTVLRVMDPGSTPYITYDAWRDKIVVPELNAHQMSLVDSDGSRIVVPLDFRPRRLVAVGDGRIYGFDTVAAPIRLIDENNQVSVVMEQDGVTPFDPPDVNINRLGWDQAENVLLLFGQTSTTHMVKLPLTAAGDQLAGPIEQISFDVSASSSAVVGASPGPGGRMMLVLDNNENTESPRMQLLDVSTMTLTAYASNGPYLGAAATNAGCYSPELDRAVVLDTFDNVLRTFSQGQVGDGAVLAMNVSGGGSGEEAQLVRCIGSDGICHADTTGDGVVNFADLNELLAHWGQSVTPGTSGDVSGDGVVDFIDLNALLAAWECGL